MYCVYYILTNIHTLPCTYITEAFVEDLNSYEDGVEGFTIKNIMLPPSPFFSSSIMPIITANITTITSLELVDVNLKAGVDVDMISKVSRS